MAEPSLNQPSTLIRQSEIYRHAVLNSVTLEQWGRVDVLWMYPQVNRVLGIVCKPHWFGSTRLVFKLPQIQSVKTQVLVDGTAEETTVAKVQQLESLIGLSVWSDGGEPIGRIIDCLFDLDSGVIIRYLFVPDGQVPQVIAGFTEGVFLLSPKQIKSFSRQRVLIADETVDDLRPYNEGIRQKLANMTTALTQDYWDNATEEWRSLSHHVQSMAHRATDQFWSFAEKAKSTAQNLSQTLSQNLSEQSERASLWGKMVQDAIVDEEQLWNDTAWVGTLKSTAAQKSRTIVTNLTDLADSADLNLKDRRQTLAEDCFNGADSADGSEVPQSDDQRNSLNNLNDQAEDVWLSESTATAPTTTANGEKKTLESRAQTDSGTGADDFDDPDADELGDWDGPDPWDDWEWTSGDGHDTPRNDSPAMDATTTFTSDRSPIAQETQEKSTASTDDPRVKSSLRAQSPLPSDVVPLNKQDDPWVV